MTRSFVVLTAAFALAIAARPALAQQEIPSLPPPSDAAPAAAGGLYAPSVFDLILGTLAADLPTEQFDNFACGTNGGPPSRPLPDFTGFAQCRAEAGTGWHEVYFEYDDEPYYAALARHDQTRAALYQYTSVYSRPVIASALFDDDGFMMELRLVSDPRVDQATREEAHTLAGFLQARYDGDWQCADELTIEGETPYQGIFIKRLCTLADASAGVTRTIEEHLFRKPGQFAIDPDTNTPTHGQFESSARYEETLTGDIADRAGKLAAVVPKPPTPRQVLAQQAMNCPGCDLSNADLRRSNLSGANLAGANLSGANLHAVDLSRANLAGANLTNANINHAILTAADLTGATLSGAMVYDTRLDGAHLSGATMPGLLAGKASFQLADFTNVIANDSDFTDSRMSGIKADGANFTRCGFNNAQMTRGHFAATIFTLASMRLATLTYADLTGAKLNPVDLTGADLRDAILTNADFTGARLGTASMARAVTTGAIFTNALLPPDFTPN